MSENFTCFSGYVSQKNWSDNDPEVECTVTAMLNGNKVKTVFMCVDPLTALEMCRKNPQGYNWTS